MPVQTVKDDSGEKPEKESFEKESEAEAKIVKTEGVVGGKARIKGTRIRVIDVVQSYEHLDYSIEKIAYEYRIDPPQVLEALKYYYDNPQEIREQVRNEKKLVERLKEEGRVKKLADII